MTLYTRWVIATVGTAVAALLITLPIYRYAVTIGAAPGLTAWTFGGSLIELALFVLVTYWALAPVFPRLTFSRYASWTVLPTLVGYGLWAAFVPASAEGEAAALDPAIAFFQLFVATAVMAALVAAQWLALKDACEGWRAWFAWTYAATVAYFVVGDTMAALAGGSLIASLSTPAEQVTAYLAGVGTYVVFGLISGFGVAQLKEKM